MAVLLICVCMNPFLHVLSVQELNELFLKESKKFMIALKYNVSPEELQKIRNNIVEIARILHSRESHSSKDPGSDTVRV